MRNLFAVLVYTCAATTAIAAGINSTFIEGKVNGNQAKDFIVSILFGGDNEKQKKGVGIMISMSRIITAADVIFIRKDSFMGTTFTEPYNKIFMFYAALNVEAIRKSLGVLMQIINYHIYNNYQYESHINNIALLMIDKSRNPFFIIEGPQAIKFPELASDLPDCLTEIQRLPKMDCCIFSNEPNSVFLQDNIICALPENFDRYKENNIGQPILHDNKIYGIFLVGENVNDSFRALYMVKLGNDQMICDQMAQEATTSSSF